jgi:hypothetical protein
MKLHRNLRSVARLSFFFQNYSYEESAIYDSQQKQPPESSCRYIFQHMNAATWQEHCSGTHVQFFYLAD